MIKIATDSCNDLSQKQILDNKIAVFPLTVILGDEEYLDGVDITPKDIFEYVAKTGVLPKTAARSSEDFKAFFASLLEDGSEVVFICISSELSSTYQNALLAQRELDTNKLYIVDSRSLSTGIGLHVMHACKLALQGIGAKEIAATLSRSTAKVQASFIVDSVEYLYKGGRCSAMARFGANLLRIKPRLELIDGKIENTAKYMGVLNKVLKKYVDEMLAKRPKVDNDLCFITHTCTNPKLAEEIADYVRSKGIFKEVVATTAGATISSHCGPNTLGILYREK